MSRSLLSSLHPTPAVCGDSPDSAFDFIRKYETLASYDRGFYAGPFGYIGHDSADVVVAIRSGLVTNYHPKLSSTLIDDQSTTNILPESKISVFAGAGIVNGSTVQGEWTETSHKLGVISSLFPSSPITLQSYSSPNVGWSSAFIEEFVRCGVTTFYICPGSRNTPLTTAIFKATRSNIGIVRAISVHDERGAGFRALGYARQHGRPAAVVTSSGTAVANLYPSVVEASSDGIPLLLLTADRPYESRDTGSNQSIDQVKVNFVFEFYSLCLQYSLIKPALQFRATAIRFFHHLTCVGFVIYHLLQTMFLFRWHCLMRITLSLSQNN